MTSVATIDFHVTSECSQECPYCWGPQDYENPVDTPTAEAIVRKVAGTGARRIVFTGGDPLQRSDIGRLVLVAKESGLEVALSTTGDELTREFLSEYGPAIDLISLPLDGASEEISSITKEPGHFAAIIRGLELLAEFPAIDVKVATPVTRHNIHAVPAIVRLLDKHADRMPNRLFYNVFQVFPRAMSEVDWDELVVSAEEFAGLRNAIGAEPHRIRINWLDQATLDRLYVMIFPDGSLTIPSGSSFRFYGAFLEVEDLEALLGSSDFDAPKHLEHAKGWERGLSCSDWAPET
jgi:MoaA/NifB/PqqE/SkfB family radical SAM enzyme